MNYLWVLERMYDGKWHPTDRVFYTKKQAVDYISDSIGPNLKKKYRIVRYDGAR